MRPNLKQEVAQHIRDMILTGAARPGQRLDQDGIAAKLGVSRLPVREALITLEAEGLVENVARRGSFVASLEPDDIRDHYEMYGQLSGIAAARAAAARSPQVIERLEQISVEMAASHDPREHDRLNYTFHQIINKAGGSRRLISVLRTLSSNMPTHFFEYITEWSYKDEAMAEHEVILEAIRAGDGPTAASALALHFSHTGEEAVKMLRATGFWDAPES